MKIALVLIAALFSLTVFAAKLEVEVKGMTCGMCVSAITKELEGLPIRTVTLR